MMATSGSATLYAKLYRKRLRIAAREWHWLHMLPLLGISSAQPVAWLADRHSALIVTAAVPGRSLDSWAVDAAEEGWLEAVFSYACRSVAPFARRLHRHGLIHRDFNSAHLFCADPRAAGAPSIIDVERVFRPRLRWQRWIVKDLASLLASSPVAVPISVQLRFLRRYAPDATTAEVRKLARAVGRKARRVHRHQPRYG
jgi:RIO-like serine/threonine protein kinase